MRNDDPETSKTNKPTDAQYDRLYEAYNSGRGTTETYSLLCAFATFHMHQYVITYPIAAAVRVCHFF